MMRGNGRGTDREGRARIRIAFLIPSLIAHGAERQLCELVRGLDRDRFEIHLVVSYAAGVREGGDYWAEAAEIPGLTLHCLNKRPGPAGHLTALPRLWRMLRRIRPDLLHGYLDANLPTLLVGRALSRPVAWGIRRSSHDRTQLNRLSRTLLRVMAWLSPLVDLVIFNSEAGRDSYHAMGMRAPRMVVIPNGFDVDRFAPDEGLGREQRRAWGIPEGAPLIGIVGRLSPVKDHPAFLRAAERLAAEWPDARFVCAGGGGKDYTESLKAMAASLGIADRVIWPGACGDMPPVYNALTVLLLSSAEEGFPNVLGEAMACGVPCVTTQVGDAAALVGGTGLVVPRGDDAAMAAAVSALLREPADAATARGRECRSRICASFSTAALARNTEEALLSLIDLPAPASSPSGA
jgi:glycosyltransferase involved in cell wall biosynthesis